MPLPFATWTIEEARNALTASAAATKPLVDMATKFYEGDHWQNGAGWIGPRPLAGEEGEQETLALIERSFVSKNAIKEVVDRHRRGVIGLEPEWGFTPRRAMKENDKPTDEEVREIDAIEAALTEWWDARKIHRTLKNAIATLLRAQHSPLRLYVPVGLTKTVTEEVAGADGAKAPVTKRVLDVQFEDDGLTAGLRSALAKLYIEHPLPANAGVYTDPASQTEVGILIYKPGATGTDGSGGDQTEVIELVWVDENGQTILRTIKAGTSTQAVFDMARKITMHEMVRDALITTQITQHQKALNQAATVLGRAVITSGFLERILFNAQMPGEWVDENGQPSADANSRKRFIPGRYKTGAGTTNFLRGFDYLDEKDGSTKIADPSAVFREPSSVAPPIEAAVKHYTDILDETDQSHVLMNSEATPSGRSREQARAAYVASLEDTSDVASAGVRWLLEAALAEAEALSGKPNVFSLKYRAYVSCRLNAGPLDVADRQADETSVEKGTMSDETAMTRNGIIDVDAEKTRINQSDRGRLDILKRQGEALSFWTGAGLTLDAAAEIVIAGKDPITIIRKQAESGGFEDDEEDDLDDDDADLEDEDTPPKPPPTPPAE